MTGDVNQKPLELSDISPNPDILPNTADVAHDRLLATLLQRDALLESLRHMKSCGPCSMDDWNGCEGGRAALALLGASK